MSVIEEGPLGSMQEAQELAAADENVHLAAFRVGADEMVLDIMRIREILRPVPVTPLPQAPLGVRGIVNVRGAIIPLMDVRMRFGLPADDSSPRRRVMVVLDRRRLWGLQVDQVSEVVRVPRSQLRSGVGIFSGRALDTFAGVCEHRGRLLLLLNLARFLSSTEALTIPELPAAAALQERT